MCLVFSIGGLRTGSFCRSLPNDIDEILEAG